MPCIDGAVPAHGLPENWPGFLLGIAEGGQNPGRHFAPGRVGGGFRLACALFCRYVQALATVLAVKDRVLAHNPVGALYRADGYDKNKR